MTDTTDNQILHNSIVDPTFQDRVRLRFIAAAISVTTEVGTTTSHTQRLAFAGALFANTVDMKTLVMSVLANATVRASVVATPNTAGGNALDSDIDFQVASIFTGIAVSRAW